MCRCINCFAMAILKFKMAAMSDLIWSPAGRDRKIRCAYRLAVWIRCRRYSFVIFENNKPGKTILVEFW